MSRRIFHLFVLFLFDIICNGWCSGITTEPENVSCSCEETLSDLVKFVIDLDNRLSVASREIARLVTLHSTFAAVERKNAIEHKEIRNQISKLAKERNSGDGPSSEILIAEPGPAVITSSSSMADEASKMENFTTLIKEVNDKFKEVKSLISEVTELQQENKVLKEDIEKEKRMRRHLQERLNQTESLVVEIKEMVDYRDSRNSTIDEVAEIVFAKIAEFDILNKSAIETQLKKLEYTVKDVFKNEIQLVQRLDSVENANAYAAGLLENGTLADKMHNIASTVQILEEMQSQQGDSVNQLEQIVDSMNYSVIRKLEEVQHAVSTMDSSTSQTILIFANELSKMNDTWNNKSVVIDQTFSDIQEKITETSIEVRHAVNITRDIEESFKSVYSEALSNVSVVQKESEETRIRLQELELSVELTDIKSILNGTADKDEFYELRKYVTEEKRLLLEKMSTFFYDMSEIINNTAEKIADLESKYIGENEGIKQYFINFSSQQQQVINETIEDLSRELHNLKRNQSTAFSFLEYRMENLSLKLEEVDRQNSSISSAVHEVRKLHDLLLKSSNKTFKRCEDMEEQVIQKFDVHKKEIDYLIGKLEVSMNSTTQTEEKLSTEDEGAFSRQRIYVGESSDEEEGVPGEPVPCTYVPLTTDAQLAVAYRRHTAYEELSTEALIPHGEQLLFSCKKIGRFILSGSRTLTCVNGQWSTEFPSCEKLLDEADIRGKLHGLVDIVPPIDFAPIEVGVVNSRLATSVTGELVMYPGVTLNLLCLYPRELGEPQWVVEQKTFHPHTSAWDTGGTNELRDTYKLKLTIAAATEDDSGDFTCISPSGRRHTIAILVKAIKCDDFAVDPAGPLSVSYDPQSEDVQKVMTTQASFECPCGYSLNGSNTAICKASGTWSHNVPTCHEEEINGCIKPELYTRPGLLVHPEKCTYSIGEKIFFKCENAKRLMGATTARCSNDGIWTVAHGLPSCVSENIHMG